MLLRKLIPIQMGGRSFSLSRNYGRTRRDQTSVSGSARRLTTPNPMQRAPCSVAEKRASLTGSGLFPTLLTELFEDRIDRVLILLLLIV